MRKRIKSSILALGLTALLFSSCASPSALRQEKMDGAGSALEEDAGLSKGEAGSAEGKPMASGKDEMAAQEKKGEMPEEMMIEGERKEENEMQEDSGMQQDREKGMVEEHGEKVDAKKLSGKEKQGMEGEEEAFLEDLSGTKHSLSDWKGKKVYLKFWASWCSICLAGLDELDELSGNPDKDFEVISVVSPGLNGEKDKEQFRKWFEKLGYQNMKVLLDEKGELVRRYGVRAYPSSAFIGSDGSMKPIVPGHKSKEDILTEMKKLS